MWKMKTFLIIYLIGMLCKLFKHILQIGQLVGMFIQYMFLWLQCWKLIIPESLFITVGWIVKSATKDCNQNNVTDNCLSNC